MTVYLDEGWAGGVCGAGIPAAASYQNTSNPDQQQISTSRYP